MLDKQSPTTPHPQPLLYYFFIWRRGSVYWQRASICSVLWTPRKALSRSDNYTGIYYWQHKWNVDLVKWAIGACLVRSLLVVLESCKGKGQNKHLFPFFIKLKRTCLQLYWKIEKRSKCWKEYIHFHSFDSSLSSKDFPCLPNLFSELFAPPMETRSSVVWLNEHWFSSLFSYVWECVRVHMCCMLWCVCMYVEATSQS